MRIRILALVVLGLRVSAAVAQEAPPTPEDYRELKRNYQDLAKRFDELAAQQQKLLEAKPPEEKKPAEAAKSPEEKKKEEKKKKEKPKGIVTVGAQGFEVKSPDGATFIKLGGWIQLDGRAYFGDNSGNNTFLVRRARPILDVTFFDFWDFRLQVDFAQSNLTLFDAYTDFHPFKWLRLRAGKFKTPVGLERLQFGPGMEFLERGYPTALVPNRDVGVMLHGELWSGVLIYQVGAFMGVADTENGGDSPGVGGGEVDARLFSHPFRELESELGKDFGIGVAGTWGKQPDSETDPSTPTYKSAGQQTIFKYRSSMMPGGTAFGLDNRWRVTPQLYWYVSHFGLLAEFVYSSQDLALGMSQATVANMAWQVRCSVTLTPGDYPSYGGVKPSKPLDFKSKNFGAVDVVVRYEELRIGDNAFPTFANPDSSVRGARGFGLGVNWYPTRFARFGLNYYRTDFQGGAPMGGDRPAENALIGRIQTAF
jgi:phosphate-selective porin OprO/OprP